MVFLELLLGTKIFVDLSMGVKLPIRPRPWNMLQASGIDWLFEIRQVGSLVNVSKIKVFFPFSVLLVFTVSAHGVVMAHGFLRHTTSGGEW